MIDESQLDEWEEFYRKSSKSWDPMWTTVRATEMLDRNEVILSLIAEVRRLSSPEKRKDVCVKGPGMNAGERTRVYVAGPYSQGDVAINVREAMRMSSELLKLGYAPFCPHLTHFWHMLFPQEYQIWLNLDNEWMTCCDALLRIPGESSGADPEVALAESLGLSVFFSLKDFTKAVPVRRTKRRHKMTPDPLEAINAKITALEDEFLKAKMNALFPGSVAVLVADYLSRMIFLTRERDQLMRKAAEQNYDEPEHDAVDPAGLRITHMREPPREDDKEL